MLIKLFLPNEFVNSVFEITPQKLKEQGIKAVITDLDNTLVEWDRKNATPRLIEWLESMQKNGILVTIVSNNNQLRVSAFSDPIGVPFIYHARKPRGKAFRQAIKDMRVKKEETVVIGDQLLTDVLGGNLNKLYTILVVPVAKTDGFLTRINRRIERRILKFFKRKNMIQWEDPK
ncbi:YqeG family HAD IIIA-type phosphatase [Jeotgalibacillus proteolyticus]|uniref:YqeG family HAD IIIA-type phosphatase n=1 Tax=Jeotgalibacillus proteolyticus TaxID=2082395 RepID=A0A2S5GF32_9BACL|nr:YqeG family HAD IIIA-type phosphatase [Jeotgalibacillus proteolyticus]PPA71483.1 YqeG family HAD IIIA-type phosphatase [Jeotgalibacillus proteolyticus]